MPQSVAIILGIVGAIAATILAFIFITPSKNYNKLNKFCQFLADLCNFRFLVLEYILKAVYILFTAFCLVYGFFTLFSSMALAGLATMIFGPIAIRIMFEFTMMFIILVRNTNEMNKKMSNGDKTAEAQQSSSFNNQVNAPFAAPQQNAYQPDYVYCQKCGTKYDANMGGCPNGCDTQQF